ncbi:MAG: hypothetical protein NTW80_11880, partial [Deltaproteobacteria bacterium]|nr:hypothetical protein [Deltaproteobacteria bacterium]
MKISQRKLASLGVLGLALIALIMQPVWLDSRSWAQEKIAAAAPEIKVPKGTPDALTAMLTRRSIRDYSPHPVPEELIKLL